MSTARATCRLCMFWAASLDTDPTPLWGECRRRAKVGEGWPRTERGDWCGELVTPLDHAVALHKIDQAQRLLGLATLRPIASD